MLVILLLLLVVGGGFCCRFCLFVSWVLCEGEEGVAFFFFFNN